MMRLSRSWQSKNGNYEFLFGALRSLSGGMVIVIKGGGRGGDEIV